MLPANHTGMRERVCKYFLLVSALALFLSGCGSSMSLSRDAATKQILGYRIEIVVPFFRELVSMDIMKVEILGISSEGVKAVVKTNVWVGKKNPESWRKRCVDFYFARYDTGWLIDRYEIIGENYP